MKIYIKCPELTSFYKQEIEKETKKRDKTNKMFGFHKFLLLGLFVVIGSIEAQSNETTVTEPIKKSSTPSTAVSTNASTAASTSASTAISTTKLSSAKKVEATLNDSKTSTGVEMLQSSSAFMQKFNNNFYSFAALIFSAIVLNL